MINTRAVALVVALIALAWGLYQLFWPTPRAKARPLPAPGKAPEPARPPKVNAADPDDEDITLVTLTPSAELAAAQKAAQKPAAKKAEPAPSGNGKAKPKSNPPPSFRADEEAPERASAVPIVVDDDAAVDEPTRISALILVSASAQTDQGRRRKHNEDSFLVLEEQNVFVVADGMGGHAGGEVASKLAVDTVGAAFLKGRFEGEAYADVPRRGSELALAIQMANRAIYEQAQGNAAYHGMGTTLVAARFSPNKQRLYVGHVGDSRCYRLRGKKLTQITTDHTMGAQGITGPLASHLNRAVGVQPGVKVDLIIARPWPEDVYLLCSDGLSKMVPDEAIQEILLGEQRLEKAVSALVERANSRGGRDNITVILVQVKDPKGLASYIQAGA